MSVAIVSIPSVRNWRFQYQDKAKNAFLSSSYFSSQTLQRYVFFFTMQRSNENILSSGVKKGIIFLKCCHPCNKQLLNWLSTQDGTQIICNSRAVLQTPKRFKKTSARFDPNASAFFKNVVTFFFLWQLIIKSLRLHLPEQPQTYFMMFVSTN